MLERTGASPLASMSECGIRTTLRLEGIGLPIFTVGGVRALITAPFTGEYKFRAAHTSSQGIRQ